MPDARGLFAQMRAEMAALEARIRAHPFVARAEAGEVPRERFRGFAGEQYHIIESDLRSVARLVARHPEPPAHDFLWGTLQGEKAAFEHLLAFGAALGLDRAALAAHDPDPRAHAYTAYMAWLGAYGSAGQVAAAFALNFAAWGANCARLGGALEGRYGFAREALGFFDLFANPPADLEDRAREIVAAELAGGMPPALIRRAARLLQGYELMFWDAMEEGG